MDNPFDGISKDKDLERRSNPMDADRRSKAAGESSRHRRKSAVIGGKNLRSFSLLIHPMHLWLNGLNVPPRILWV
jgi:hypothetical protein